MKRTSILKTSTFRYAMFGILAGCLFPILGTLLYAWINQLPIGWSAFVEAQQSQKLL